MKFCLTFKTKQYGTARNNDGEKQYVEYVQCIKSFVKNFFCLRGVFCRVWLRRRF